MLELHVEDQIVGGKLTSLRKKVTFSNGSGCCHSGIQILDLSLQLDLIFIEVNFVQLIQILFVYNFTSGLFLGFSEKFYILASRVIF
jgi:hypothetical protein